MIELLKLLYAEFVSVLPESYNEVNESVKVKYPYLTYSLTDSESLDRNQEGYNIDVDIFDNNSSYANILTVEDALKSHFEAYSKEYAQLTDDFLVRVEYLRSNKIPTGDDNIKRRNLQFYFKIDWRNK
ncbi:MAG: hypothetical protein WCS15_10395 [Prevotella sp.]